MRSIRMSKPYFTVNVPYRNGDGSRVSRQEAAETRADIKLHYPKLYAQMSARNTREQADALCNKLLTRGYEVEVNETSNLSF